MVQSLEFWKTQTHALIVDTYYSAFKKGNIYKIITVLSSSSMVVLESNKGFSLGFDIDEIAPVSSLVRELL